MVKVRKYTNRLEAFLQSDAGQRFFNVAFSVGAAIVIWGALFEILHVRGGKTLLCVGMGTEILMFILTAFDRPPKDPDWDQIANNLKGANAPQEVGSLTIVDDSNSDRLTEATSKFVEALEKISEQINSLQESIATGNSNYLNQLSDLNRNIAGVNSIYELQLKNISGQLASMDSLNSGLQRIKDMYEKSANDSERYCEETEKMTNYMKQINAVYANMIAAMSLPSNPKQ